MARWTTKEDVISDMVAITGLGSFDDSFITRGAKPPPPRRDFDIDEEEFRLRYGDYGNQLNHGDSKGPDLAGITEMLRMVDESVGPGERLHWDQTKLPETQIIISKKLPVRPENWRQKDVSKTQIEKETPDAPRSPEKSLSPKTELVSRSMLNPAVPSFVPKREQGPDCSKPGDSDGPIPENPEEMLKKTIIEASKANRKREKNVAMAALLKLKTSTPILSPNSTPRQNSPFKMIETTETITRETEVSADIALDSATKSNHNNIKSPIIAEKCNNTISTSSLSPKNLILYTPEYFRKVTAAQVATPAIEELPTQITEEQLPQDEIEESIKKVEDWMEQKKTEKPKPKTLFLKPVMFKRKSAACVSPVSQISSTLEAKHVKSSTVPSYVPSSYATELVKKYEENAKAKQPPVDMFTKLEADLKARDEEIRKKSQNQSLNTSDSPDTNESFHSASSNSSE